MATISTPKTTYDLTVVPSAIENAPQKVLIIGQQTDDTSADGILVTNVQPDGQEDALFGQKSMLATAIRAFRTINTLTQIDAIPLNDAPSSTAASSIVTFSGTATETNTLLFYIQSKFYFPIQILVNEDDTNLTVAATFTSAVNNEADLLVTAVDNLDGTVTLSSVHTGLEGNYITLSQDTTQSVAGITVDPLQAFTGGLVNPDITNIFTQLGDTRYQTVLYPASYDTSVIKSFLTPRFNPTNAVLDGYAFAHKTDTLANLETEADALNSQVMILMGNKPVSQDYYKGSALFEYDFTLAAYVCALRTLRLTENANIANYLVGGAGSGNNFGGVWLAAVPYHNTPVPNAPVISTNLSWTRDEQTQLNNNGVCFMGNNLARNEIILGEMVTTYLTNTQGRPDTSFKFLCTLDTGSNAREFFYNNTQTEYAQAVLTQGDIVPNSRQVNIESFNAYQIQVFRLLTQQPYTLCPAGSDARNFYKNNLNSTADYQSGTINTIQKLPIVTQLRNINATLEISFTIQTV